LKDIATLFDSHQKKGEIKMAIKVGDTIKFRSDLVVGKTYSHPNSSCDIDFLIEMKKFRGKSAEVRAISSKDNVLIVGSDYYFNPAMFYFDPIDMLEPGYVVELRKYDYERETFFFIVMPTEEGLAFVNDCYDSFSVSEYYTSDLKRKDGIKGGDIVAIYGLNRNADHAFTFGKDYRKLVWQEKEPQKVVELTMEEVAKLAGYSVDQIKIRKE
jgi:hypothetical protein